MMVILSRLTSIRQSIINTLSMILRTWSGRIALPIVLLHLILAIFGPWLAPYSPTEMPASIEEFQNLPPSPQFWLGTDQYGRDVLSRVMCGATSLITTAAASTALGIVLGTSVGMSSGYKGGRVDEIIMRIMDGLMSFPTLLLALLVLFTLGPSRINIAATIGFVSMPAIARVVRSTTLSLKTMEFVQSARLRGESTTYIIFNELLPNVMPVLGVEASVRFSYAILSIASLGFLGLGVQPPSPDWGLMISQSRRFLVIAPWVALAPMGAIVSLIVGVNLLVDGIKQASGMAREKVEHG
ncbi:MAG TPA: ABC transporter permease [Dehalococcoidia bacterium]|nr:ABC transporter permease [Dehalococcoidia bacterium]